MPVKRMLGFLQLGILSFNGARNALPVFGNHVSEIYVRSQRSADVMRIVVIFSKAIIGIL